MGCALNDPSDDAPVDPLWGGPSPGESRWPASIAVLGVVALQIVTPNTLSVGPRWLWPAIALPLVAVLVATNPSRLTRESCDLRQVSLALVAVLLLANVSALGLLMHQLLGSSDPLAGKTLLWSAIGIWARNVTAFGIWYWELDRGGPIRRCSVDHAPPDFLFPQMQSPAVSKEPWSPRFVDYLYVSLTNSTAFSPTDTLPLTSRAKLLMGLQGLTSLATIAVVGARAVNILS